MAVAAILKNQSQQWFDRSSWNLAPWCKLTLLTLLTI